MTPMTPMTELPRRPYVEQMPPPDGLQTVRGEATRRRRRRLVGVTAGSAVTAAAAVVAILVVGANGGTDVLRPLPPAVSNGEGSSSPAPATSAAPAASEPTRALSGGAADVHQSGRVDDNGVSGNDAAAPLAPAVPSESTGADPAAATGTEPTLQRTRTTHQETRLCGGSTSNDDDTVNNGIGWCLTPLVTQVNAGQRLTVEVCRDSTAGGSLNFASTREVDLVVSANGNTIWNWAHAHPGHAAPHTLSAGANGCWDWSVVWSGQTNDGGSAPHGTLTFTAVTTAQEMRGNPSESTTFDY